MVHWVSSLALYCANVAASYFAFCLPSCQSPSSTWLRGACEDDIIETETLQQLEAQRQQEQRLQGQHNLQQGDSDGDPDGVAPAAAGKSCCPVQHCDEVVYRKQQVMHAQQAQLVVLFEYILQDATGMVVRGGGGGGVCVSLYGVYFA